MKVLLVVAVLISSTLGTKIRFKPCYKDPTPATITNIEVDPCPEQEGGGKKACILHRGNSSTIAVEFVSKLAANQVSMVLKGRIEFVWVPFKSVDMCGEVIQCPIKPNKKYKAWLKLPILKHYPVMHLVVSVEMQNEHSKDLSCDEFPVQIK